MSARHLLLSFVALTWLGFASAAHSEPRRVHWTEVAPPSRVEACALYDSVSDRLVLLGGQYQNLRRQNGLLTTWECPAGQPEAWTRSPLPSFPGAQSYSSALDPVRRQYWQFGVPPPLGGGQVAARLDLADGSTTMVPVLTTGPLARTSWVGYNAETDRLLALGSLRGAARDSLALFAAPIADTLRFARLSMEGPAPIGLTNATVAWDPVSATYLVLGGSDWVGALRGVLVLDTRPAPRWTLEQAAPDPVAGVPGPYLNTSVAYDGRHRAFFTTAFILDGIGVAIGTSIWQLQRLPVLRWVRFPDPSAPEFQSALAVDTRRGLLVALGGFTPDGLTQRSVRRMDIANRSWERTSLPREPEPRYGYSFVYDHGRDRAILFGGGPAVPGPLLNDVWARDSRTCTWERIEPAGVPPVGRFHAFMVAQPDRDQMLLLGGNAGLTRPRELWALSFSPTPTWTPLEVQGTWPDRIDDAAWDAPRDRLVVFGATDQPFEPGVWELKLSSPALWRRLPVASPDPPPHLSALVMEAARGRAMRYGGYQPYPEPIRHDEIWGFALARDSVLWERISEPNAGLSAEYFSTQLQGQVVLDPARDRLVSFGGWGSDFFEGHATERADAFPLSGAGNWQQLVAPEGGPPPTVDHALVYDPIRDAVLVFGAGAWPASSGVFELDGGFEGWPDVRASASSSFQAAVRIEWRAEPGTDRAPVLRRLPGSIWTRIGEATRGPDGVLRFADSEVSAGQTVAYRLAWPVAAGELPVGDISVVVGVPLQQALSIRGNPATGPIRMDLDLPAAGDARLQLIDLAGRVVMEEHIVAPSAGRWSHELVPPAGARAGLYFVRVRTARGLITGRVTLLR